MPDVSEKKIFIAEVADKMQEYKANFIRELEYSGCTIHQINRTELLDENYFFLIEHCECAIHLLSGEDTAHEGSNKGLEERQIEYSLQHLRRIKISESESSSSFKIFAWYPRHFVRGFADNEPLPPHLERIQQLEGIEFLKTNFEGFKQYLLQKIYEEPRKEDDFFIKGDEDRSIYFIYDKPDQDTAERFIPYLRQWGFKVLKPMFKGDVLAVRRAHQDFLRKFDIAIVYAVNASATWANMKIMEIMKAPGLGREKDVLKKAIITTDEKKAAIPLITQGFDFLPYDKEKLKEYIDDFLKNPGA